ncbi:FecCD family ABC transporter permease [Clostridium sp. DL1XJH146]
MSYFDKQKKYRFILLIFTIGLFFLVIFSATMGIAEVSFIDSLNIIIEKIPFIGKKIENPLISDVYRKIVLNIRLPRILVAGLVGANLAVVGTAYQGIFKNPMADPYVLGVSTGGALGATIAIILGGSYSFLGMGIITFSAFVGSLMTIVLVYSISKVGNKVPTVTLLLSGISVSFFASSLISLLMVFNRDRVDQIIFWTMGSVSTAAWKHVYLILPITILGTIIIYSFSRDLNVMTTGEEQAYSLGVNVEFVKKTLLVISSLMVAVSVSITGIIGFVGLIIPHMVRISLGPDHRALIPLAAIGGAMFMIICDTIARSAMPPTEIPVGAITALFGAPFFIYLLIRNKNKGVNV